MCHTEHQPPSGETLSLEILLSGSLKGYFLEQPTIFISIVCPAAAFLGVKSRSGVAQVAELSTTWGRGERRADN